MDTKGYLLAILGGFGLGLLVGGEFAGPVVTVSGGVILAAVIIAMLLLRPGGETE